MRLRGYTHSLTDYRALLPYSLLGLIAGICSAAIILGFEFLIDFISAIWLGPGNSGNFESLDPLLQFAIPVGGALVLGVLFTALPAQDREVGIVHVLSRMHSHYGQLPLRNALVQMVGGALALGTGQSGGREGPGVHLGAAINSSIASGLNLPNNSQRILIACGTAGSIAVAFNTPLAGVIFAMEVIVAEYSVVGFTPVILAAVSATTVRHSFSVSAATFSVPTIQMASLLELPYILLLGIVTGAVISVFIMMLKRGLQFSHYPLMLRFGIAGLITGALALLSPAVLGMGYDTLNQALLGEIAPTALLLLIGCKLLATSASVSLGMPIGLIGPSLVIGGCLGGVLGYLGGPVFPELATEPSLYVVLGMGAAMAALLNAPLAAILAVVELTQNIFVVFPSMLAIVAATLTTSLVFKQRSAHQTVLRHLQREIPEDPVSQLLHQTNVNTVMDRDVAVVPHQIDASGEAGRWEHAARWCLVLRDGETLFLVAGDELVETLAAAEGDKPCDLTEKDLRRWSVTTVAPRATLREALDKLRSETAEAVIVTERGFPAETAIHGVVTRDIIDQFYLRKF
jgi:H+/Cl- antiporter ClcA